MPAVEAFIIESAVSRISEPGQLIPAHVGTDDHNQSQKSDPALPVRPFETPASPSASQAVVKEGSPSNDASSEEDQDMVSASLALNTTAIAPLPVRPQEDNPGSKSSAPAHPVSGTEPVMVLGTAGSPRFIHRQTPVYPIMARKLAKEGKVVLKLTLDSQGKLQDVNIVETSGFGFAEAASAAIRKSTLAPALKNGRAVSSQVFVPVRFVLNEGQ